MLLHRFFLTEMKWCGQIYSSEGETHDPERIRGLAEMRCPEAVGGLTQVLQAKNWMRPHLPCFTKAKARLQALMDERLVGARRTKHAA